MARRILFDEIVYIHNIEADSLETDTDIVNYSEEGDQSISVAFSREMLMQKYGKIPEQIGRAHV